MSVYRARFCTMTGLVIGLVGVWFLFAGLPIASGQVVVDGQSSQTIVIRGYANRSYYTTTNARIVRRGSYSGYRGVDPYDPFGRTQSRVVTATDYQVDPYAMRYPTGMMPGLMGAGSLSVMQEEDQESVREIENEADDADQVDSEATVDDESETEEESTESDDQPSTDLDETQNTLASDSADLVDAYQQGYEDALKQAGYERSYGRAAYEYTDPSRARVVTKETAGDSTIRFQSEYESWNLDPYSQRRYNTRHATPFRSSYYQYDPYCGWRVYSRGRKVYYPAWYHNEHYYNHRYRYDGCRSYGTWGNGLHFYIEF